jgi:hypothetical protein
MKNKNKKQTKIPPFWRRRSHDTAISSTYVTAISSTSDTKH